jgi:protein-tyrosine phosphatase
MFFSRKKKWDSIDLGWLKADMHSHLIPGIDDGSPDLLTSVAHVRGLVAMGYKKLITTPHILWELYPNTPERISVGIEELRKAVQQEGIEVELHAAAEYFIDDHFDEQLRAKAPLLTLSGNMVLVEFSMITAPMDLQDVIFELQIQNYQPVLAHPERYVYMSRKKDFFDDLKTSGCHFQLNLLSLTGYYGPSVLELAEFLMKKNYYDFAGTDLHHEKHLEQLKKLPAAALKRLQDSGNIKNHLL